MSAEFLSTQQLDEILQLNKDPLYNEKIVNVKINILQLLLHINKNNLRGSSFKQIRAQIQFHYNNEKDKDVGFYLAELKKI